MYVSFWSGLYNKGMSKDRRTIDEIFKPKEEPLGPTVSFALTESEKRKVVELRDFFERKYGTRRVAAEVFRLKIREAIAELEKRKAS